MSGKTTILVVDDELQIRKFLRTTLVSNEYDVIEVENGKDAKRHLGSRPPELMILDLGLPDMDGIEILKELRSWSQLPVIVLSARGQEQYKVQALEEGADDYLTKPFGTAELLARIKVALRHGHRGGQQQEPVFKANGLTVDLSARVVSVDSKEVKLTPTEYKLLAVMVKYAGKVVTHGQLLREVWGKHSAEQGHYLRIYMQHIRQKLGDDALSPRFLITETGVGYRLKD
ncbi:MAG: response regulator [Proteobacteria bacterium]|nr:response regulator [Pseudomonadota bacterium]